MQLPLFMPEINLLR